MLRLQSRPEKTSVFCQDEKQLKTIQKNNQNVEIFYENYMHFLDKFNHMNKAQKQQYELTTRVVSWENTNFLLHTPGFNGLKTGITEAAGPCLAASYQREGHFLTIVILACKSMEARWQETSLLVEWAKAKIMRPQQGVMRPLPPAPQTTLTTPLETSKKKETRSSLH